jgi:glyceraldehyde 3-phosphate dehydrogenase
MSVNLGVNGFGRIGRLVVRSIFENNKKAVVGAINDPFMDVDYLIYQLKYDSAHLRFPLAIEKWEKGVVINGQKIRVYAEKDPAAIKWGDAGVNVVCESTGAFLKVE